MIIVRIGGIIREKESRLPLPGLFIKAYDKDLLFDDLLGSAVSDPQGRFEIVTELRDFKEFLDARPDLYFRVFRADRRTLLHTTEDAVRWNAGPITDCEILVPGDKVAPVAGTSIVLTGEDGERRDAFEVGESLVLQVRGLRPGQAHDIGVLADGKEQFTARLIANLQGEIEPTVLWPQLGLDDPLDAARLTIEEARKRWQGRTLTLHIGFQGRRIAEHSINLGSSFVRPLVLATDRDGRLLNGFEVGKHPLNLTLGNLAFGGQARIFMVPRQHDWRPGDPFRLAPLRDGRIALRDVEVQAGSIQVIAFAEADALLPGAYDFIVRPLRFGREENDLLRVLAGDVIGGRRVTGLVIHEPFWTGKPILGGCVNKLPISGRSLGGAPYFQYSDTFAVGESVYAAIDPGIVDPGNISKMCALYVVPSKTDVQWNLNNNLNHLAVLGGNAAVIKIKVQSGCINANKVLVWPNAMQPGEYDIVADFGNNTSNAMTFAPDNDYNTPLDAIDGYFVAGFRVVEDPGTLADFAHAGNWNYNEAVVNAMGLSGNVMVADEAGDYHAPGNFSVLNWNVPMRAHVFFPADLPGVVDPAQISAAQPDYPLVVVVHGNGHSYTDYDFLLAHFAKNGFVAASIHVASNMSGLGRANLFFQHMTVLQTKFAAKIQNNIGIMGHSRGGEAVLKVARLNQQLALGHNINAVISLAPTDQYGSEVLGGAWAKPYFVLYGSRDGDITGGIWTSGYTVPQTGFALFDRANGAEKSMVFVYGATHNGFITDNHDGPWDGEPLNALPDPVIVQQPITKAYMNAFFRQRLKADTRWEGMFTGEWKPASVIATGAKLYVQYVDPTAKAVDDFEGAMPNWQSSTIGGNVSHGMTLPADPEEGRLHHDPSDPGLDPKSPHDTKGLKLRWDNVGDRLVFDIPFAERDVTGHSVLSFRIAQKVDSAQNPANQAQDLRVALKDTSNNERAIRVGSFAEIPYPDHRANAAHDKSALATVRIPLKSYTIVCAGLVKVDLANVASLSFQFSMKPAGEIEIDDIEFTD